MQKKTDSQCQLLVFEIGTIQQPVDVPRLGRTGRRRNHRNIYSLMISPYVLVMLFFGCCYLLVHMYFFLCTPYLCYNIHICTLYIYIYVVCICSLFVCFCINMVSQTCRTGTAVHVGSSLDIGHITSHGNHGLPSEHHRHSKARTECAARAVPRTMLRTVPCVSASVSWGVKGHLQREESLKIHKNSWNWTWKSLKIHENLQKSLKILETGRGQNLFWEDERGAESD